MFKFVVLLGFLYFTSITISLEISQSPTEGWTDGCQCYLDVYEPICGSDGKTYTYACLLECAKKTTPDLLGLCYGECPCCKPKYENQQAQPSPYRGNWRSDPYSWQQSVPSSKLKTLKDTSSTSSLSKDAEASVTPIVVVEIEGCPCDKKWSPVCGSDNVTYGNPCVFECQQEIQATAGECPLTQACRGECPCCSCSKCNATTT